MGFQRAARLLATSLLATTLGLAPGTYGIPSFDRNTGWINGNPLGPRDLDGKVVLVDFWEYTCINCLRTLPYLRTWYSRYHDDGLVIVGVHTPEFEFSGERENVEAATRRLGIQWPVALDDRQAIWAGFGNDSWPNEYLFDKDGRLVDTVSGEGHYQETERKIQQLLAARNSHLTFPPVMALLPEDSYTKPGAVCYIQTPEILVARSPIADADRSNDPKRDSLYTDASKDHLDGKLYLQGKWHLAHDAAVAGDDASALALRYHAIQLVAVLAPERGTPLRVDVTQDGAPIAKGDAGKDVRFDADGSSYVMVDTPRAYDIVDNAKMAFHELRLMPKAPGADVYSFAFESCEATPRA